MHSYIGSTSDLPPELSKKPLSLVGVCGLDTLNNAIHKSIWEILSNNRRSDRSPVRFKLIDNAHEFPVIKPKRTSYDWYIPKGILKKNWMSKHLLHIPAVMVIFYELDWNDSHWNEKMIECSSRVQSMRAALEGRNTRITVVLIQNTSPLPPGEDVLASDRAINLCANCELNANSLFVLPHGDHLQGYVMRLEGAFYEFAQNYYHNEIKHVRAHKEHLNKNSHQFLLVRHQFKMGFLYELKQDMHTAHKHYTHAYNNLLEIRIVDTNALEIRTIAGFINYKLCKLMFVLNLPRDAISQFKTHIDRFKCRMGFQELIFEHYAWISTQFSVFGDIFDEAVKQGLPAVQTQHPGIYYQQGAQYAVLRKHSSQEICANINVYPDPDPLTGFETMEFYGQRPWRPGKLSADAPDPQIESNGIQAIQYLEKQVSQSSAIISLLGSAISQYKQYRCPRTRRHLVLQMADEYYNSDDFGKALTLLSHMIWDFRNERWWLLLTDILEKAIRCAYITGNIDDYLLYSFEVIGKYSKLNLEQKRRRYDNIQRILERQVPFSEPNLAASALEAGVIMWRKNFDNNNKPILMDFNNVISCIEVKARFQTEEYQLDQTVTVELYIQCTSPLPLTFTKIFVQIKTPQASHEYPVIQSDSFLFKVDEIKRFQVDFTPEGVEVNSEIRIESVHLIMGDESRKSFDLKFDPSKVDTGIYPELLHFKYCKSDIDFENILPLASTTIVPRHSKLEVDFEYETPALLGEWFEIKLHINNKELHDIKDIKIQVFLIKDESITEFSSNSKGVPEKIPLLLKFPTDLNQSEKCTTFFFIRAHKIIENEIEVKISYSLGDKSIISIKSEIITIPVVKPFEIITTFLSSLMEETTKFYVGEEIGVRPTIHCQSPFPLIIEDTSIEFLPPFKSLEMKGKSNLIGTKLRSKEVGVEMFWGVCDKPSDIGMTLGQYHIRWKRENGLSTTSQLSLMGHPCEWVPISLEMKAPAHGTVSSPLLILYKFYNKSHQLLRLDVTMEASEAFLYAGYKQFSISLLPDCERTIQYNLYPLIVGSVTLPKLLLSIPENTGGGLDLTQDQLKALVNRSLPTYIYVMPRKKGALPGAIKSQ